MFVISRNFVAQRARYGLTRDERQRAGGERVMAKKIRYCRWTYDAYYDNYDTACGQAFALIDGTLAKNGLRYCTYCGKRIKERRAT